MSSCEKCWASSRGDPYEYRRLLQERSCSPEEQAGPNPERCMQCKRRAIHVHTGECMNCGCYPEGKPE